jgi:hypothetical protein
VIRVRVLQAELALNPVQSAHEVTPYSSAAGPPQSSTGLASSGSAWASAAGQLAPGRRRWKRTTLPPSRESWATMTRNGPALSLRSSVSTSWPAKVKAVATAPSALADVASNRRWLTWHS